MVELPQLDGQIRVLVIEDDLIDVQSILVRCTEAGMDTRYAPPGSATIEAVRSTHPHLIVLGRTEPEAACLQLVQLIGRESAAPLLVLTEAHTNFVQWREFVREPSHFIAKNSSAQAILERITNVMSDFYHEKQLMVAVTPTDSNVKGLPVGWGKCQHCGYIGPRAKFRDPNPLARHPMFCPVCKQYDDIVFSMA